MRWQCQKWNVILINQCLLHITYLSTQYFRIFFCLTDFEKAVLWSLMDAASACQDNSYHLLTLKNNRGLLPSDGWHCEGCQSSWVGDLPGIIRRLQTITTNQTATGPVHCAEEDLGTGCAFIWGAHQGHSMALTSTTTHCCHWMCPCFSNEGWTTLPKYTNTTRQRNKTEAHKNCPFQRGLDANLWLLPSLFCAMFIIIWKQQQIN